MAWHQSVRNCVCQRFCAPGLPDTVQCGQRPHQHSTGLPRSDVGSTPFAHCKICISEKWIWTPAEVCPMFLVFLNIDNWQCVFNLLWMDLIFCFVEPYFLVKKYNHSKFGTPWLDVVFAPTLLSNCSRQNDEAAFGIFSSVRIILWLDIQNRKLNERFDEDFPKIHLYCSSEWTSWNCNKSRCCGQHKRTWHFFSILYFQMFFNIQRN